MRRRDFFKRLGTVSAAVAIPTLTIAAIAVKSSEPELPKQIRNSTGKYERLITREGHMYKMSYDCKVGLDYIEVQDVSLKEIHQQIEDHFMKGVSQFRINGY